MYEQAFRIIDDTLRQNDRCSSDIDYVEQTCFRLFLKHLHGYEDEKNIATQLSGDSYQHIIDGKYKWNVLATPKKIIRQ